MKNILSIIVASVIFATNVSAMEVGKIYIKSGLGYRLHQLYKGNTSLKGFDGELGFGYILNDDIRLDMMLNISKIKNIKNEDIDLSDYTDMISSECITKTKTPDLHSFFVGEDRFKLENLGIMASLYYDFHGSSGLTPYLMTGFGLYNHVFEVLPVMRYVSSGMHVEQYFSIRRAKELLSLAYQLGAGFQYEIERDIYLDINYRVFALTGKYRTTPFVNPEGRFLKKGDVYMSEACHNMIHDITIGARLVF